MTPTRVRSSPPLDTKASPMPPPPVWIMCSRFGKVSEAWMRRQARMLASRAIVQPRVVCWDDQRSPTDPDRASDPPVDVVDSPLVIPRTFRRRVQRLFNVGGAQYFASGGSEPALLRSMIDAHRPAAAVAHFGHLGLRVLPVMLDAGVPLVVHFHGADLSSAIRSRRYVRALRETLPRFAACVGVAQYMRDLLLSYGADPARVHVIPLGAPVDQITFTRRDGRTGPCRFIAIGRFVPKKAPLTTLRAFARASPDMPGAMLTMLGDGDQLDEARSLTASLNMTDRILLPGAVPQARVRDELDRADVLVQHSVTGPDGDREGWPISIAEAMAAGLPVIATRHAGIVDQVVEGDTGLLVDEHDATGMTRAMISLARDPAARAVMGAAGRARAEALFDCRDKVSHLERVLLGVATAKRGS